MPDAIYTGVSESHLGSLPPYGITVPSGAAASAAFSPSDLSGLQFWLKADALGLSDGTAVSSWTDSSSNARHFTQATGANQPVLKTNIINGKPVVRFSATDFMRISGSGTTGFTAINVFVVAQFAAFPVTNSSIFDLRNTADTGGNTLIFIGDNGSGKWWARVRNDAGSIVAVNPGTDATITPQVWEEWWDGANLRLYKSGTQLGTDQAISGTATVDWNTHVFLGESANPTPMGTDANPADIAEIICYSSGLSAGNRTSVKSYLGTKYGITVA